jgi:phage protein D
MGPSPLGDITFWSSISAGYVEIEVVSNFRLGSQILITGMIDTALIDPILGTVAIEGRDLTSSLIDSYRQESFVNQTASEVVSTVARNHDLFPVVTSTSENVGRYYGDGYTRLSLGDFSRLSSDWDLLVELARENDFDVFVHGRTLLFQPSSALAGIPLRISPLDVQGMRIERNLALLSDTSARVQSWDSQNMTSYVSNNSNDSLHSFEQSAPSISKPYLFSASNLTSQQTSISAERYAAELRRLSTVLYLEMPWDPTISPRTLILLDGTGASLDGTYRIENIERHYGASSGSVQSIRAALI